MYIVVYTMFYLVCMCSDSFFISFSSSLLLLPLLLLMWLSLCRKHLLGGIKYNIKIHSPSDVTHDKHRLKELYKRKKCASKRNVFVCRMRAKTTRSNETTVYIYAYTPNWINKQANEQQHYGGMWKNVRLGNCLQMLHYHPDIVINIINAIACLVLHTIFALCWNCNVNMTKLTRICHITSITVLS